MGIQLQAKFANQVVKCKEGMNVMMDIEEIKKDSAANNSCVVHGTKTVTTSRSLAVGRYERIRTYNDRLGDKIKDGGKNEREPL